MGRAVNLTLAYHVPSEKILHIEKAANGLSCECICVECSERLEAVQGRIRQQHFRHHQNINCKGGIETALHLLAKQIIVESNSITLPENGVVEYRNAVKEQPLPPMVPDVTATLTDGKSIFFEIYHSHAVDSAKELLYINGLHKSVEIDMACCPMNTYENIKDFVLLEIKNKRIIFWELKPVVTGNDDDTETIIKLLIGAVIGIGLFKYFRNRFKTKK